MEKLDKILKHRLAERGLSKVAEGAQICFLVEKWGMNRCRPISLSKGVLKVSASSSSEASELQMDSEKLIDFLNKKMGKNIVQRLRIVNIN
jgi:hypothetical protein